MAIRLNKTDIEEFQTIADYLESQIQGKIKNSKFTTSHKQLAQMHNTIVRAIAIIEDES